jgi:hypothetical protein
MKPLTNPNREVRIDLLHFNRYKLERKPILEDLEDASILAKDNDYIEKVWKRLDKFFAGASSERDLQEVVGREGDYLSALKLWREAGAAIFTLRDDLVGMFLNTDVDEVPINSINMPYSTIYCHLGDSNPFPDFDPVYKVDGFYLWADPKDLAFWNHEPYPDIKSIRKHRSQGLQQTLDMIKNPAKYNLDSTDFYEKHLENSGGPENYVEAGVTAAIQSWEEHEKRYNTFLTDPDTFVYCEGGRHEYYLGLNLLFTVVRKDGTIKVQSATELIKEPFLHAFYDFQTHRYTVREAIDANYYMGSYAMEHHISGRDIDPFNELVIDSDDENYVDLREDLPDGSQKGALNRMESYLNVTNRPDLLQDMTRLAFNALCYLNWKDRDVILKYPSPKLEAEEAAAKTQKEQELVAFKARNSGYRKLYFCGYTYPRVEPKNDNNTSPGTKVKSHWRRGDWRNQSFGKGLRDTKLIWIKPVIVAKNSSAPAEPTIYQI